MALLIKQPNELFYDTDGSPLEDGSIYIGVVSLDPREDPVAVYWDEDLTDLAAQPLKTIGGSIFNNGKAANIYTATDYSLSLFDKSGNLITYWPAIVDTTVPVATSDNVARVTNKAALKAFTIAGVLAIFMQGYDTAGDLGFGEFRWDSSDLSAEVLLDPLEGFFIAPDGEDGSLGAWVRQYSGAINIGWFSGKVDGSNNDALAVQAIVNYLISKSQGGTIFTPAGSSLWATKVVVNYPSPAVDLGSTRAINFIGDGQQTTEIKSSVTGDFCLEIIATNFSTVMFNISDIKFEGSGLAGDGISVTKCAIWAMNRVFFYAFQTGLYTESCVTVTFIDCVWRWNWYGWIGDGAITFSPPNAFSFFGCVFGNNYNQGFEVTNPGSLNYYGGAIESNGNNLQGGEAQGFGCKLIDAGNWPSNRGGNFDNVIFDNNGGLCDVWLLATTGVASVSYIAVNNCWVSRSAASGTAPYGLRVDLGANAVGYVSAKEFKLSQAGSYVPNASNKLIQPFLDAASTIHWSLANLKADDDVELPALPEVDVDASCTFDGSDSTPISPHRPLNISNIAKFSAGVYVITLSKGHLTDKRLAVSINAPGFIWADTQTATNIEVRTFDIDGTTPKDFTSVSFLAFN